MDTKMIANTEPEPQNAGVLFDLGPVQAKADQSGRTPRLRYANREQMSFRLCSLDGLIPDDHPVRAVWAFVHGLDLKPVLNKIQAVDGGPGAPATDPRILMTLWLYAVVRSIGSARELDRRCHPDLGEVPFQWI